MGAKIVIWLFLACVVTLVGDLDPYIVVVVFFYVIYDLLKLSWDSTTNWSIRYLKTVNYRKVFKTEKSNESPLN